jgi:ribonuclease PH
MAGFAAAKMAGFDAGGVETCLLGGRGPVGIKVVRVARTDGRNDDQLRDIKITRGYQDWPAGSVLIEFGNTRVLCAASVSEGVPRWRQGSGLGWVTAEYAMLPSATHSRSDRESVKGKLGGRTHEISRLIGRSLRSCIDLSALGENTIVLDCDVIQADGGTRTAAITGGYVALHDAITWLGAAGALADPKPLSCAISAVSVGVVDGRVRLDLPYEEDSRAEVDMNVVCTDAGTFVEVQGTGEGATFPRSTLDKMLDMALAGADELCKLQEAALEEPYPGELPEAREPKQAKGKS